jgi:quercetin dioxygenase-like cupin family protein
MDAHGTTEHTTEATAPGGETFRREMRQAGASVSAWSNGPGDRYGPHSHPYRKVLCCLEGSIVFHLPTSDETLSTGQRLVIEPGTVHSATVGPAGVRCAEAHFT